MPSSERAKWGILRDLARRNFTVAKLWLLFADSHPFMPIQAHMQFAKCMLGLLKPIYTHSRLHAGFALTQEVAGSSPVVPANIRFRRGSLNLLHSSDLLERCRS